MTCLGSNRQNGQLCELFQGAIFAGNLLETETNQVWTSSLTVFVPHLDRKLLNYSRPDDFREQTKCGRLL